MVTTPTLSVHGLEDKVNKWLGEITEQQERLMRQAAHVNAWDQLLQLGHDQVQQLRDTLNKVKVCLFVFLCEYLQLRLMCELIMH